MVFTAPNPGYFMETLRLRLGFNTASGRRVSVCRWFEYLLEAAGLIIWKQKCFTCQSFTLGAQLAFLFGLFFPFFPSQEILASPCVTFGAFSPPRSWPCRKQGWETEPLHRAHSGPLMMGLKPHPQVCTHVKKSMEANAGVLWGKKIINLRSVTPVEQITTVS